MARAHAVIASHTTVGATARHRPITRACLLGLLVSWWAWASGASWAEAAPDLVGSSLRVIQSYGSYTRVEWTGRNQGPDATAGAWQDYLFISPRSACCAEAILLGVFPWGQWAAVAPGATYTQEATVLIPPLPLGNYSSLNAGAAGQIFYSGSSDHRERRVSRGARAMAANIWPYLHEVARSLSSSVAQ